MAWAKTQILGVFRNACFERWLAFVLLAWPVLAGAEHWAFMPPQKEILRLAKEAGFETASITTPGGVHRQSRWELPRFVMSEKHTSSYLELRLSGYESFCRALSNIIDYRRLLVWG